MVPTEHNLRAAYEDFAQLEQTMVTDTAVAAGLAHDRLYFSVAKVGDVSAAGIPPLPTTPSGKA